MPQEVNESCFELEQTIAAISKALSAKPAQVEGAIRLFEEGCSIPFVARYRKEATGGLDEIALRVVEDLLHKAKELADRKSTMLRTIAEQGLLTDTLRKQILSCDDKKVLEVLYLPFKPKRKTRASTARERGLQPLADLLMRQETLDGSRNEVLQRFVSAEKDVPDRESALRGACDIVAEQWSEGVETRNFVLQCAERAHIVSKVKRGKKESGQKFEMYFDHREPIARVPSHRLLAMKRGEAEGVLRLAIQLDDSFVLRKLKGMLIHNPRFEFHRDLLETVEDCHHRLLVPATESVVLSGLKESADNEAITVFARNLRELLLAPPAGPQVTLAVDPGFRTGCKVAVVDATGKFLEHENIYPTPPRNDREGAAKTLRRLIAKHDVELIAIGNGTASREADAFVTDLLNEMSSDAKKIIVSEAGASIYSASEIAVSEYPDLDVTVRGAISIAHRLQDPLAELIKIDPKSIGVGQYQHDVNQTQLKKRLDREVESCVNSVGVDLNRASASLLTHVAGIGPKLAERIVAFRNENGPFEVREQLCEVPKLGRKAFQQSAGFLRIRGGRQPLDNSAVHPESYCVVEKMAASLGLTCEQLVGNSSQVSKLDAKNFVNEQTGMPTVLDIIEELAKPGRDPRKEFRVARFAEGVNELTDLKEGMVLEGVISNVTRFGAFVDVGVHQDGLIHISELDGSFVQDPNDVVSVGDVVRVKVLEVDTDRRRIALSRKQA